MQAFLDPWRLEPRPGARSLRLVRELFVRGLGLVHLMAFLSLWVQIDGLIGSRGLLPADVVAEAVRRSWGWSAAVRAPSLYWLWPTDGMLHGLCALGVLLSIVVMAGYAQGPALLGLFVAYLSLYYPGQEFLSFQWDLLLLETTFVALFVAPWRWKATEAPEPAPIAMSLVRLLAFKLMVLSGFVKLASLDPTWWGLTALTYHYWTQPLPNPVAWYADRLPLWFQEVSAALVLVIEFALPWAVFAGRIGRLAFGAGTAFLMALLALTGNYGFFQPLTLVLLVALLDDEVLARWTKRPSVVEAARVGPSARAYVVGFAATVILLLNAFVIDANLRGGSHLPRWEQRVVYRLIPWRIVNTYGLFAVMTTERPEIVVEGSLDGVEWRPYAFRWKPGDLDRAPPIVAPHMPRLDWQMWFAGLQSCEVNPWVEHLMDALLEGRPQVLGLLGANPFPDGPPKYVRTTVWSYTFADPGTGAWWKREGPIAPYCPARSRE